MNESIKVTGSVDIVVTQGDGTVRETRHIPNLVVTAGKAFIASRMAAGTADVMSHMALGSGVGDPLNSDTTLGTERGRVSVSTAVAGSIVSYTAIFPAGTATNAALTEAGIFNAASSGTMLCRTKFTAINKQSTDSITVVWNITIN